MISWGYPVWHCAVEVSFQYLARGAILEGFREKYNVFWKITWENALGGANHIADFKTLQGLSHYDTTFVRQHLSTIPGATLE